MIEAINLSKRYEDGILALDRLALRVEPGEIYCLLGANGAGKTTAINLFLGFIEPTGGRALIDGIDTVEDPLGARKSLGYLPEKVALYPSFTARQNLDFFCRVRGRVDLSRDDYDKVMARMGLPEKAFDQQVRGFSKGMLQKLGLAIVVLSEVPALLLDEPMSGLDPKAASDLVETLKALRDGGKAILMSTHDIFRARIMADRVGIMKGGKKIFERTIEELRGEDLEQLYLEYIGGTGEADKAEA